MRSNFSSGLQLVLLPGLLTIIVGTALAGGVVTPWAKAILSIAILLLFILWVVAGLIKKQLEVSIPSLTWPLLAAIGLATLQSIAWTDAMGIRQSLSLDVEATREVLFLLFMMLFWFLLSNNLVRTAESFRAMTRFLVIFGLFLAFGSLVLSLAWQQNMNWLRPIEGGSPFGPFVNRNHFAGYMELLLPFPMALLLTYRATLENRVFYVFAAVMMGLALCLSLSRGGIISLLGQMVFLISLNSQVKLLQRPFGVKTRFLQVISVTLILGMIVTGVVSMGAEPLIFRFAGSDLKMDRGAIWADSWQIFRAHPLLGSGLGTFETSFPLFANDKGLNIAGEAHNDYLQVLTDAGLLGFAILLWFFIILFRQISQSLCASTPHLLAITMASATGVFGLLLHSLFDFNLQLPSHALVFLLYCSVCSNTALLARQSVRATTPKESVAKAHPSVPVLQ